MAQEEKVICFWICKYNIVTGNVWKFRQYYLNSDFLASPHNKSMYLLHSLDHLEKEGRDGIQQEVSLNLAVSLNEY